MYHLWDALWKLELVVRRIGCFFTGHNERPGNQLNYQNDFCTKCLCDWPHKINLPDWWEY